MDVTGTATIASIVTVNEQPTIRLDEYFAGTASGDNSTSAISITADIHAVNPGAGPNGEDVVSTATKSEVVPPETETFTHDDDGNLTADGKWTYTWDAENRLIAVTPKTGNEALLGKQLAFGYDTDAKLIWQDTANWNEGTNDWDAPVRGRHLYDGWNLLVIADDTLTTASKRFAWGYDLSSTQGGAGGVGGLLLSHAESEDALPMYDGNGNVLALTSDTSAILGKYEYGFFGQLILTDNPILTSHKFQWSTKLFLQISDLHYYGYRFYNSRNGRWNNRDILEEQGGVNLYGFVNNLLVNRIDFLGLKDWKECVELLKKVARMAANLVHKLSKNDPISDGAGGHPHKYGITKPGGHYKKMRDLQRGIKTKLSDFVKQCLTDDDDRPTSVRWLGAVDRLANLQIPLPIYSSGIEVELGNIVSAGQLMDLMRFRHQLESSANEFNGAETKIKVKSYTEGHVSEAVGAVATVGGAAVGCYVIYRVVRFAPSLVPALWSTIPANLVTP